MLRRQGVPFELHGYAFSDAFGIALEAAQALGIGPGRLLKTLIALVDDRLVVALVPADRELVLKAPIAR